MAVKMVARRSGGHCNVTCKNLVALANNFAMQMMQSIYFFTLLVQIKSVEINAIFKLLQKILESCTLTPI